MTDSDGAAKLFLEHLDLIERVIRFTCHGSSSREDDVEDFASYVKLKLIENDYAVIRKHDQRASFAAFISVVVKRLFLDYRIAQWGKWHASAEARRLGERGVTIEAMLVRDGRTIEEVMPMLLRRWPKITRYEVEEITRSLPHRVRRPRPVEIDLAAEEVGADGSSVHAAAFEAERTVLAQKTAIIVRAAMNDLEERDRLICKLHFEGDMTVAEIARTLRVEQKPLYRRLKRALARIRARLESRGIGAQEAVELLSTRDTDFDFGFGGGTPIPRPSNDQEDS